MSWARPFRKRSRGGPGGRHAPPGKISEQTQNIFNEILIFTQTNTPGRSSSDELGEAREVRPFDAILIIFHKQTHQAGIVPMSWVRQERFRRSSGATERGPRSNWKRSAEQLEASGRQQLEACGRQQLEAHSFSMPILWAPFVG